MHRAEAPNVLPLRPWTQRAARLGLWGLVGVAAAGGLAGLVRPESPRAASTQVPTSGVPAAATGFAEYALRQWLTATPDGAANLEGTYIDPPDIPGVAAGARRVASVTAVSARPVEDGYWAVTLAAELVSSDPASGQRRDVWFFELGVVQVGSRYIAAGPPGVVPGLRVTDALRSPAALPPPEPNDEITASLDGFFRALLAGGGDVSRYLAPGTGISAVSPPPFVESAVTGQSVSELAAGSARARVEVEGTTAEGGDWTVAYEVLLALRGGRWEVTALSGAPSLAERDEPGRMTTTTSPPRTTSSTVASEPGA